MATITVTVKSSGAIVYHETTNQAVGRLLKDAKVVVDVIPSSSYYRVAQAAGGNTLARPESLVVLASDFAGATPTWPQFPKGNGTSNYLCGVNVIDRHDLAWHALSRGCRTIALTGTGDATIVAQIKQNYPDATVILRPRVSTWGQQPASAQDVIDYWFYGVVQGCIHLSFNEGDAYSQGGQGFLARCQMEVDIARLVRDRGGLYAAGGWSMGNPNFEDPYVQQGLAMLRGPYNEGWCGLNMHLYSPGMSQVLNSGSWPYYMTRWQYLFTDGGFDPNIRNVICDEHGLDNTSNPNGKEWGGFPAQGASAEDMITYCNTYRGATAGSPVVAGTLFVLNSSNQQWLPFNVEGYLNTLDGIWS